jgi:YegS/Rv2252/BmrU family lipid kinase
MRAPGAPTELKPVTTEPTDPTSLPPLAYDLTRHPAGQKTAALIYNPVAGSGLTKKRVPVEEVRDRFIANGWHVGLVPTRCALDGTEAAKFAMTHGADVVVAMGGDGTVNEVVQALVGTDTPLGIVPAGTINVLAQELNLPLDPLAAVDVITSEQVRRIDLGRANGRYFTMMIGLGYDAESTNTIIPDLKKWTGPVAYYVAGVQAFAKHKSVRATMTIHDGKKTRRLRRLVYMMIVSNVGLYAGGVLKFTPEASFTDGLFDVCLIRSRRWYRALLHVVLSFLGGLRTVSDVEFFQVKSIKMTTGRPFPYQLDGDPAGTTPVTIEMVPRALAVVAPPPPAASP